MPAAYYERVRSSVPVLMLSGERDPATPPRWGRAAAESLSAARQIRGPRAAHAYDSECLTGIVAEFFARGSARDLDTACVERVPHPPFVTR